MPKDWKPFVPPYETQYSTATHTDAENCVSESFCHIIDILTGKRYSPRALAYLSHTTPQGNTIANVLKTANEVGLIPYDLWPTPDSFDWNSYYAPIPDDVLKKAEKLVIELRPADLNFSPLWTELHFTNSNHMVAQINNTEYFDSEIGSPIKTITQPILYQSSLIIKPMNKAKVCKSMHSNTVWVCYPVPNEDYLMSKCSLEGIEPPADINNIPTVDTLF